MNKLTLRDLDVRGKRVLVRVDFNVPTEERDGSDRDHGRHPHARELADDQLSARTRREDDSDGALRPAERKARTRNIRSGRWPIILHTLINHPVAFSHDTMGKIPEEIIAHMQEGDVALLENVRFQPEEEANDPKFAEALAKLGDLYVNDAFGAAHRAHASTAGMTKFVSQSAMGFLMEKELKYLQGELDKPAKPFVVIMGGSKVSDKIGVIKALMEKADTILIGGAMANTFWKAQGIPVGASRVEADKLDLARELLGHAKKKGVKFLAPGGCARGRRIQGRRAETEHRPGDRRSRDHGRLAGSRYRPRHDRALRRRDREGENNSLERSGRGLRDSRFRRRHDRDRGGRREGACSRRSSAAAIPSRR